MSSFWLDKRVLITGGAGFIGSNLAARLLQIGARQVRVVDNLERGKLEYLAPCRQFKNFEFQELDLRQWPSAETACQSVDVIFHLASKVGGIRYYIEHPGEVFSDNLRIDHNTWSAAVKAGVPFYLYASSAHVYPRELQQTPDAPPISEQVAYPANPELSYGWAKLFGEQMIQYAHREACHTRAALPRIIGAYGPNQDLDLATGSAIPVFCRRAIEYPQQPFRVLGTGQETRSFHFISDTLNGFLKSVEKLPQIALLGPYNFGMEGRVTIEEIARTIIEISNKPIEIEWNTSHPTVIWGQSFDCRLAAQLLDGWQPSVSLKAGLIQVYQHIQQRLNQA